MGDKLFFVEIVKKSNSGIKKNTKSSLLFVPIKVLKHFKLISIKNWIFKVS